MSVVDDKQRTVDTDFEQCYRNFREAVPELFRAIYEYGTEDQAKTFHELLEPLCKKINAISDGIKAAKRKERTDKIGKLMPKVGDEALVDICPWDDETWMQFGRVLMAWHDDEQAELAVWAAIEITRAMTDEENAGRDWQTDDMWNGCVFVCRYNDYLDEWRAYWPVGERATELWGSDEADE